MSRPSKTGTVNDHIRIIASCLAPSMKSLGEGYRALVIGATGAIGSGFVSVLRTDPNCAEVVEVSRAQFPDFSLENEAIKLQNKADSTLNALELEEVKRKKEKDEFNKKMAQLSKLSTTELASYFAKRYNN